MTHVESYTAKSVMVRVFVNFFFIFGSLLGSSVLAHLDREYPNSAYLDELKTYKLYWKVNHEKKSIQFAARVKTLGWVGFGISSGNGNMVGSDVVIGWVKDNVGHLKDRYAHAKVLPLVDDKQDYTLIAATESHGETVLEFSRLWDTCDEEKDVKIETGTARLIYAYHTQDPVDGSILQHTTRGSRSLVLLNINQNKPTLPNDAQHFDLLQNDTVLPSIHTSYLCKAFEIQQFPTKRHIIQIDPVISPGNEGTVHHILVYRCTDDFPRSNLSVVSHCYERNMPPAITACAGGPLIAGWAIGGGPFVFPKHAGFPLGTSDAPKFVVMEIHYDNPNKLAGIRDSSGLRFHYTPTLRQYDAAVLWVGDVTSTYTVIPPKQEKWLISSYCTSECTKHIQSQLPDKGINIFGVFLHAHLQGLALRTRHIRNGTELPEIASDNHYDFNYQEFQHLNNEIHMLPGDEIIQECFYQSKDKSGPVYGGLSTNDEMCLSFLYYYPKVDLNKCESVNIGFDLLIKQRFTVNGSIVGYPPAQWTEEFVRDIKESYINQTHVYALCKDQKNNHFPASYQLLPKPVVSDPLKKPDVCKLPKPSSAIKACLTMPPLLLIAYFVITIFE